MVCGGKVQWSLIFFIYICCRNPTKEALQPHWDPDPKVEEHLDSDDHIVGWLCWGTSGGYFVLRIDLEFSKPCWVLGHPNKCRISKGFKSGVSKHFGRRLISSLWHCVRAKGKIINYISNLNKFT